MENKIMDFGIPCKKDYNKRHFWERRGVVINGGKTFIVWQCSQCGLGNVEILEMLIDDDSSEVKDGE